MEATAGENRVASRVAIVEYRVRHTGRRLPTIRFRSGAARPFPHVPSVIGPGLAHIDLFPVVLTNVVDIETGPGRVRVERHAEGVA